MGNTTVKDAVEGSEGNRSLDLSCKLTPSQYIKHTSGEFIEGCLSALPWEVYFNVSLYENVNASFNFINEIPVELSIHVPHLRSLNVSHNQICDLPTSFNLLLHLRVLDLSYNKLKMLPAALTRLPQLHTLNVANNYLKELPTTVSKLQNLKKLNVSNNQLRALPGCLVECPKLTVKASVFVRVRGQQVLASVSNPESASMEYRQAQGTSRTNKRKCPLMPPVNATTLKPDQLKNMLLGLLYGMAIGDAMALNTEGLTVDECIFFYDPENLSLDTRIYDYLRTHFPPHDWSSNTDIMILTLDSLMRWGGVVDELELASQLDQWRVHGYADLDPSPGYLLSPFMKKVITVEGYSANPHAAAQAIYKQTKDEISRGICTFNPSDNSCLPSALVLGVPNFYVDHEVEMNAERICKATHADPMAKATCIFLALLMATILQDFYAFLPYLDTFSKDFV
ncbi:Dynein regulatory complex subunit 7-like 1 [Homarus americanus]|uniref:Dynein regulatory complex subunit 7-like 1 n=1 Tax=Homarus americanus TaxID=6706 RepID=A0A8J5JZE2_HOMAM|nr:Dynein regulatory complex subunit 7-like 1 [Homarus americanus]